MGEITLDLRLVIKVPEKGLTINGLIQGLKEGAPQIQGAILRTLLNALEEKETQRLQEKDPERYRRNGHQSRPRCLRCSLGEISFRFGQMVDRKTGRTFMPLVEALSIPAYDHFMDEAMEPSVGLVMHVSFRRAQSEVARIQGMTMSHTTVHSRLQECAKTHSPFGEMKHIPFRFLLVDGTKVHLQGPGGKDLGQVEMRWALASLGAGRPFEPVGFWIDKGWGEIGKDLGKRLQYRKLELLFSDGGLGIEENLLAKGMKSQRCVWHGKRDFPYLLYADGFKKDQQASLVDQLQAIPAMNLTKAHLEQLRPEDRPRVEQIAEQTQEGFQKLLEVLDEETYPRARTYIQNLIHPVTTFLSWWLKKGEVIPLNTNAIESAFSQVCNRIKRVGRRWSDKGLLNWLQVAFYKIFKPELWNLQWQERKNLVKLNLISVQASCFWSQPIT